MTKLNSNDQYGNKLWKLCNLFFFARKKNIPLLGGESLLFCLS